jgi:hypothetical protein
LGKFTTSRTEGEGPGMPMPMCDARIACIV